MKKLIKKIVSRWKMEWELYFLVDSVNFQNMSKRSQDRLIKEIKRKYGRSS